MQVILAEKPSVARDIAAFVRANTRHDGYLEGGGYQVTWAFGHLAILKEPGDYDPALKAWSLDSLPFIPERFELKQVEDAGARKQLAVIKRLFRGAERLICATDAGREGELIFRYILSLCGCENKPAMRLWLSSLTPAAIRAAFDKLRPVSEYDNLYAAARCRSEADWIVGLNATRSYTLRHNEQGLLWSVGRVQTPVLALIVRRDDEIRTFVPEPFWELRTRYRDVVFRFTGDRFKQQADAEQMLSKIEGRPLVITDIRKKQERSLPPQLYDLTELQRDMNRRYGLSAAATLKIAQSLYEKKWITYPRTDSRYLSSDMKRQVPGILKKLEAIRSDAIQELNLDRLPFSGRIVNDAKVSDHHAIIPTGNLPSGLQGREAQVYEAIVTRLIAAFYPPCLKEVTTVSAETEHVPFRAKGVRVTSPGWTVLYPRKKKRGPESDDQQTLPEFRVGEQGPHDPEVNRGETSPPKAFTENTLLAAMETAGKLVEDEDLKEALKERGLGTPATRAAMIETLLRRNYIERVGKQLSATNLGRYLIALIKDRDLKSAELTGQWEAELKAIEAGKASPERFMARIEDYVRGLIQAEALNLVNDSSFGVCPRCGKQVIQGKRGYGCSGWRDGCTFVVWPTYRDIPLTERQIRELIQRRVIRQSVDLPGEGDVMLALTDGGHVVHIPVPQRDQQAGKGKAKRRSKAAARGGASRGRGKGGSQAKATAPLGVCPLCGKQVVEQKRSFSCSGWREGCSFVIWKNMASKRITARTARTLLSKGETGVLKGFKSKAGKAFEAKLKLVDGEVRFEFQD